MSNFSKIINTIVLNEGVFITNTVQKNSINGLSPEQKVIIDALICVGKLGSKTGDLKAGIERLTSDYPEIINSDNNQGWGKKPNHRLHTSDGEKRAIVDCVKQLAKKLGNQLNACAEIGQDFSDFKKHRAYNNKLDKLLGKPLSDFRAGKDKQDYLNHLCNKPELTDKEKILHKYLSGM